MASTPAPDQIPIVDHLLVWIVGSIIGLMIYFFGSKAANLQKSGDKDSESPNIISITEDRIRNDLTEVLREHRIAVDFRAQQLGDATASSLKEFGTQIKELQVAVHDLEIMMARIEERLPHRRGTS